MVIFEIPIIREASFMTTFEIPIIRDSVPESDETIVISVMDETSRKVSQFSGGTFCYCHH